MPMFRKKPVVIEAMRFDGPASAMRIMTWAGGTLIQPLWDELHELLMVALIIQTPEGEHRANRGDWIIKGVKGEFYPCKPDIFSATYEPAEPPHDR